MNARHLPLTELRDAVAVSERGTLSRAAFWRRMHALAGVIAQHPARRWALVCEDSGWFAAGLLALAHSGRTAVLPPAPQAGSVAACEPPIDAVLSDRPEQFAGFPVLAVEAASDSAFVAPHMPDDAARIEFYTSGSSGAPKCVPKAFAQLRREVQTLERQWGTQLGGAPIAGTVPHYHLYGLLFRILWPLLSGRPFLTHLCLNPAALGAAMAGQCCAIVSSPAFLSRIGDSAELPPAAQVAATFSSGAPLPDAVAEKLAQVWGRPVIEVYGSTETGGVAWRAWNGAEQRALWQPIRGVDTEVREETVGPRLWVRSGATWEADWMPAGDLARIESDGRLVLLGRADDVVKVEDKRVSPGEMRAHLLRHAWVEDARLLTLAGRRQQLGAVIILNAKGRERLAAKGPRLVSQTLRAWLRQQYEPLLVPRKWRFPEQLPGNDMGKTEHARLLALFETRA